MIGLIIGAILLVFPFYLIVFFDNKKRAFLYILFFVLVSHTLLAFVTQFFGIFYYPLIAGIVFIADAIIFVSGLLYFKFNYQKQRSFNGLYFIDWGVVIVILISFLSLYQVHFNYTGKINLARDNLPFYHEVKNFKYPYPYFSDEWYAVCLINYSIKNHTLPLWDCINNSFFLNLEMFFHTFLAELFLVLKLNPLIFYSFISIFFNTLIIVLIYLFLRVNNFSREVSVIISLSTLYLTCGANLPGLWHFIPVHLGIIFTLLGFCFLAIDNFLMALLVSPFVIIFYGPLFIFYGLSLIIFGLLKLKERGEVFLKVIFLSLIILVFILPVILILFLISPWEGMVRYLFSRMFYISLTGYNNPQIAFYKVIPYFIIPFTILGIWRIFKEKKWFFYPFVATILFWLFYAFSFYRIIIEYERVVFFSSIMSLIIAGFGLDDILFYLRERVKNKNFNINFLVRFGELSLIILFLLLIPFYTQREKWRDITLLNIKDGTIYYPKAPANQYLTEDDLRIFEKIKGKNFLSLPWKGTVIGVATENYPVVAKEGTLSKGNPKIIDDFLKADCEKKLELAKKLKIDYIYLFEFSCPNFEKISQSQEGLVLYKII